MEFVRRLSGTFSREHNENEKINEATARIQKMVRNRNNKFMHARKENLTKEKIKIFRQQLKV